MNVKLLPLSSPASMNTRRATSSRPTSPTKPSNGASLNPRATATATATATVNGVATTQARVLNRISGTPIRASTAYTGGGRNTPTRASSANNTASAPSSAQKSRTQPKAQTARLRPSQLMDDSEGSFNEDDDEGNGDGSDTESEQRDVPTRKAGFGASSSSSGSRSESTASTSGTRHSSAVMTVVDQPPSEEDDGEQEADGKAVNVVVCLRVRPSRTSPADSQQANIYAYSPTSSSISFTPAHPVLLRRGATTSAHEDYDFRFDRLHLPPDPTEKLYDGKIRPIVKSAMRGFNGTVFAYGQTASGKTHTMMGSEDEPGIIPLAVDELFAFIHEQNDRRSFSLRVSFLEIYNEQLRDLLAVPIASGASNNTARSRAGALLEIHGDDGSVKNLEERPVSMPTEVLAILREGDTRRRVGATDWNERSSRSHAVFMVTIESISKEDGSARTSRLNLIDLAGSESATGQDERRKEGSFINKSLLTLSTVIGKLSEQAVAAAASSSGAGSSRALHAQSQHIPYRDSKLTRLLQPALSGRSRVAVICTISPQPTHALESLSTLKFARRASRVVTKAERGVLVTDAMMLRQYEMQVAALKAQIQDRERDREGGSGTGSPVDDGEWARQLGEVSKKADEAEMSRRKAEEQLRLQDLELALLRERLQHAQSFILTGPSLEANARRTSSSFSLATSPSASAAVGTSMSMSSVLSPTRGKRILSATSASSSFAAANEFGVGLGLGLGTPRARPTSSVSLAEEETSRRVAELERRLAELTAQLEAERADAVAAGIGVAALEQQLKDAQAELAERERQAISGQEETTRRIEALEKELIDARTAVVTSAAELDERTKTRISGLEGQLEEGRQKVIDLETACTATREDLDKATKAQLDGRERCRQLEAQVSQFKAELATVETNCASRDATIVALQRQIEERDERIASLGRELESVREELSTTLRTQDSIIAAARDQTADALAERDFALQSAQDATTRVAEVEELARLERESHDVALVRAARERDAAHAALKADVKRLTADLDARDAKCAHLQRLVDASAKLEMEQRTYASNQRAGTDALQARLESLRGRQTPTMSTSSSSSTSTRTTRLSAGKESDSMVPDLQARNGELVTRVQMLEKQLERVTAAGSSMSLVSDADMAASTRSSLSELNLPLDSARSSYSRPPLASTRSSSSSTSPTKTSGWTYASDRPPPLPYSPRNKDKERKHRRVTTAHDIEKLKEVRAVDKAREMFDSPSGKDLSGQNRPVMRGKKNSWE